jgi:hypothetical protein
MGKNHQFNAWEKVTHGTFILGSTHHSRAAIEPFIFQPNARIAASPLLHVNKPLQVLLLRQYPGMQATTWLSVSLLHRTFDAFGISVQLAHWSSFVAVHVRFTYCPSKQRHSDMNRSDVRTMDLLAVN